MTAPGPAFIYQFYNFLLRLIFWRTCKVHVLNRELTRREGPWILASNHISHFDPPLLSNLSCHPVDWMAMEELFRNRIFARLLYLVGTFPVKRGKADREALRTALERLEQGRVVGIFPEGGIRDGERSVLEGAKIRPGLALVTHQSEVPIVPCVVLGTDRLYNKKRWLFFSRTPIWVAFGEPIHPVEGRFLTARPVIESQLQEAFQSLKAELIQQFSLGEEDLPKPPKQRMEE